MEKQNPPPYTATEQQGYYPPPPGPVYPNLQPQQPPLPPQQHTVVVHTTVPLALGPNPAHVTCPSCHAQITTSIQTEATTKTHLFALLLCLFGFWPCAPIPYCVDSCQGKKHYCPNCAAYIGEYIN